MAGLIGRQLEFKVEGGGDDLGFKALGAGHQGQQ
jgi:hypothetical protein